MNSVFILYVVAVITITLIYEFVFEREKPVDVEYELLTGEEAAAVYEKIINGEIEIYES